VAFIISALLCGISPGLFGPKIGSISVFNDVKKENNSLYMIFKTYNNIPNKISPDYYSNYLIEKYFY
jgi:hypothetical protein